MAVIGELVAAIKADTSGLDRGLNSATRSISNFSNKAHNSFHRLTSTIFNLKNAVFALAGIGGVGVLAKSFIDASSATEQYQIRLRFLLRSSEEAALVFKGMSDYAARVPHTYQQIMESATRLSGIMRGGSEEIRQWMPLIGDLSAAVGMDIQETTSQIIRMYSAGAAAADMFRERGVTSMLGFQAGVRYTAEETRKMLLESWTKADSQFRGAADELGKTWTGLMSMISDRWFQFRNLVMQAGIFDELKGRLDGIIQKIDQMVKTGELKEWANVISTKVVDALKMFRRGVQFVYENFDKLKIAAGAFIAFKLGAIFLSIGSSAIVAAAGITTMTASMAAFGTVAKTALGVTAIGLKGGLVGLALFGGYALGDWLREKFEIVKKFGIALASGLHQIYLKIKTEIAIVFQEMLLSATKAYNKAKEIFLAIKLLMQGVDIFEIVVPLKYPGEVRIEKRIEEIRHASEKHISEVDQIYAELFANVGRDLDETKDKFKDLGDVGKKAGKELEETVNATANTFKDIGMVGYETYMDYYRAIQQGSTELKNQNKILMSIDPNIDKLVDGYNKFLDGIEESQKQAMEVQKIFVDTSESISDAFRDAFRDILFEGELDFERLGRSIKYIFANVIADLAKQKFITPLVNQMGGAFGFPGAQQNFVGPPTQSQMMMQTATPYIGAGVMGYAAGGIGGGLGAMGGMYLGGPVGAMVGGFVGSMITDMFEDDPPVPKVSFLYEVIDGELRKIGESWKGIAYDTQLIDSITTFFDRQIEFYDRLQTITGQKMADLELSIIGKGFGSDFEGQLRSGMNEITLKFMLMNFDMIKNVYGEESASSIRTLYESIFAPYEVETPHVRRPSTYETKYFPSFEDVIGSESTIELAFQQYGDVYNEVTKYGRITKDALANILSRSVGEELINIFESLIDSMDKIWGEFSQGLGNAFLATFETGTFQDFEQRFKRSIFESATKGLTEAFMSDAINIMMSQTGIFGSMHQAGELLGKYMTGEGGVSIQNVMEAYKAGFQKISVTTEELQPLFEVFQSGIKDLSEALGLMTGEVEINTEAVIENTSAILGPVDRFLQSLEVGPLAPVQSLAGLAATEQELFTSAMADPAQFAAYASFMTGTQLPSLQTISPDYQGDVASIRANVEAIPWVMEEREKKLAEEIAKALNPALLDIREGQATQINVYIGDEEIDTRIIKSFDNPDVIQVLGSVTAPYDPIPVIPYNR